MSDSPKKELPAGDTEEVNCEAQSQPKTESKKLQFSVKPLKSSNDNMLGDIASAMLDEDESLNGNTMRKNALEISGIKRKSTDAATASPSKSKKTELKSEPVKDADRNLFDAVLKEGSSQLFGNDKKTDASKVQREEDVKEKKESYEKPPVDIPKDELENCENRHAYKMLKNVSLNLEPKAPSNSVRSYPSQYTKLHLSPISQCDITAPGMQLLIGATNICFQINRKQQTGYAELYVEGHKVWHNILQYICGVKFKTKKLQVHVQSVRAYHETGGERYTRTLLREGSFTINLDHGLNVVKKCCGYRDTSEKPGKEFKVTPTKKPFVGENDDVDKFSRESYLSIKWSPGDCNSSDYAQVFPFCGYYGQMFFPTKQTPKFGKRAPDICGPAHIYYKQSNLAEEVYKCFTNISIEGYPLDITLIKEKDIKTLIVKNIPSDTPVSQVKALSTDITDVRMMQKRSYAFLIFKTEILAEKNYAFLQNKTIGKNTLEVDFVGVKSKNNPIPDLQQIRGNKLYRSSADKFESLPATSRLTKWNTRSGERRTCKSSSVAVEAMHHQADWFDTPEFVVAEEGKETQSCDVKIEVVEASKEVDKKETSGEGTAALDIKEEKYDKCEEQEDKNVADKDVVDEPVNSNPETNILARDLCSDMQESLSILQQLKSNDPNMQKILEMQQALAKLQKSLIQKDSKKEASSADPWTVNAGDAGQASSSEKEKTEKLKPEKLTKEEKDRQEMENLENQIEAAEKVQRLKEEKIKEEMRAIKEQEEKRRANWARKMIDEGKSSLAQVADKEATKLEAQKLLKAREERLKQKQQEEELARKLKEERMKEGIAQIVLPFQELITSPPTSTESPQSEHMTSPLADPKPSSSNDSADSSNQPDEQAAIPEIEEDAYQKIISRGEALPPVFRVRVRFRKNRCCPVINCPGGKRFIKTEEEFMDHWQTFHIKNMTVLFCTKCSAYFATKTELEDHLRSRHGVTSSRELKVNVMKARKKTIPNPSYRDPGVFYLPI